MITQGARARRNAAGSEREGLLGPAELAAMRRLVPRGRPRGGGPARPGAVLDRFAFSGTPGQVAGQVEALLQAGATRVEFGTPHGLTAARDIELPGRRVLPRRARRIAPGSTPAPPRRAAG